MAEPFLSEIRLMSFGFAPRGWAQCNGQVLPISQNQALFSLLGTTFGGDGRVNFALPDFRGRAPVHAGPGVVLGERGGEQAITLDASQLPTHAHAPMVASAEVASSASASGAVLAKKGRFGADIYAATAHLTSLAPDSVAAVGGSQAHLNMQPFLTIGFVIALQGIFPRPN